MEEAEYIALVRRYLNDVDGKVFDDDELGRMLDKALGDYSEDGEFYRGTVEFEPDDDGHYHFPEDFLRFCYGYNDFGMEVSVGALYMVERDYGTDAYNLKGRPDLIVDCRVGVGNYELVPNPVDLQGRAESTISGDNYGEILDESYGVLPTGYGVSLKLYEYAPVGSYVYVRKANLYEVRDYMSLVYHVLSQAYASDSEYQDLSRSEVFNNLYERRLNTMKQFNGR